VPYRPDTAATNERYRRTQTEAECGMLNAFSKCVILSQTALEDERVVALRNWRFYWWNENVGHSPLLYALPRPIPTEWLDNLKRAGDGLPAVRRLLSREPGIGRTPLTDDALMKLLAEKLEKGQILVYEFRPRGGGGVSQPEESTDAPAFPLDERKKGYAPERAAAEVPLFPDDVHFAAVAAVLQDAAVRALPFCEECARAAAKQTGNE
jgi:hypothetical protein